MFPGALCRFYLPFTCWMPSELEDQDCYLPVPLGQESISEWLLT